MLNLLFLYGKDGYKVIFNRKNREKTVLCIISGKKILEIKMGKKTVLSVIF